jgi:hypothetical protein
VDQIRELMLQFGNGAIQLDCRLGGVRFEMRSAREIDIHIDILIRGASSVGETERVGSGDGRLKVYLRVDLAFAAK